MSGSADVPEAYRQSYFVNAGGPAREVIKREVIQKKWQLLTLECSHRILTSKYQKLAKLGCGFCGGLSPLAEPKKEAVKINAKGKRKALNVLIAGGLRNAIEAMRRKTRRDLHEEVSQALEEYLEKHGHWPVMDKASDGSGAENSKAPERTAT